MYMVRGILFDNGLIKIFSRVAREKKTNTKMFGRRNDQFVSASDNILAIVICII